MIRGLWLAISLVIVCLAFIGLNAQAGNSPFLRTHVHRGDVPAHLLAGGTGRAQVLLHRGLGLASSAVSYISGTSDFRVKAHTHEDSDELLYILKGGGTLHLGGRKLELSPESAAWIPKGVEHSFVAGDQGIEAVQVYSPGGPEQRFLKAPVEKD
jgi:quercetin dioxygenase-like cupin family protein